MKYYAIALGFLCYLNPCQSGFVLSELRRSASAPSIAQPLRVTTVLTVATINDQSFCHLKPPSTTTAGTAISVSRRHWSSRVSLVWGRKATNVIGSGKRNPCIASVLRSDGSSSTPNPPSDTMSSPARRIAAAERIGVPAGLSIDTKGSAAQSKLTVTDWGTSGSGLPSVTLKLAMDRNGAIDDLSSGPKRFTCQASLDAVHRIRRDCSAVLVGVGTVVRDDPSLTVRRVPLEQGRPQPTRVVLDRTLRIPGVAECKILADGHPSIVFYSAGCEQGKVRADALSDELGPSGAPVEFVQLTPKATDGTVPLLGVLEALAQRGMEHVLVEGGPTTARLFLAESLVDRAVIVRAPIEFARPVHSGIDHDTLRRAGLELFGTMQWGDDEAEFWSRPSQDWPAGGVGNWP